ncbi:MAG TPA: molybdopterin-dependent oxidoreductase [Desulfatiglandales bacterium]|nr:molybdopterin-dependent oxidoreductase [Desulfatiglandales bacterium]
MDLKNPSRDAKSFSHGQTKAPEEKEEVGYTFCDGCNEIPFCGIKFFKKGDVVTRVESWPGFPASPLCSKGYATLQRLYNPNRLKYPMKRTNPKGSSDPGFIRISWDEAYDTIVGHLKRIRETYSPHAVFFYVGDPKEPRAAVQRLAAVYGSANYGCESSTACRRAALLAELLTYGFSTMGNLPTAETRSTLIWGTNPAYSGQPFMCHGELADAKERGVKFIVVDPRITPTAGTLADIHLRPRPATTAALAAGIMHVIFKEELHDKEFCDKWIHGIEKLKNYVKDFPPDRVAEITWIPAAKIVDAARLYATNRPGGLMVGAQGTTHDLNATNNHRAILMVPAICGYIDIPGGIIQPTAPLEGMPGPWADGPPKFCLREKMNQMMEHRLDLKAFPAWVEKIFEVQTNCLVEWIEQGKVKAFLGWGFNTMIWPQSHEYQQAIESLEFAMAVDYFYRPWTHDYVDLVLPAATNYERLAPFAVLGRQLFGRTPIKPLGECKEDWQIALEIGARLGDPETFFNGNVEAACNDILKMWDLTHSDLRENQQEGVLVPANTPELFNKHELGKMRIDGKPGFPTPSGKVEAVSTTLEKHGYPALPEYKEPLKTTEEFPLVLISGSRAPYITHSKWRDDAPWLLELQREPLVTINPKDATKRHIARGDEVILKTAYGQIHVKAKPTIMVPPGVVSIMHGWAKANVNELIPRQFDPISGYPPFKETPCEVAKS